MPKYIVEVKDVELTFKCNSEDPEEAYQKFIDYFIEKFRGLKIDTNFTTSIKVYETNGKLVFDEDTPIDANFDE